MSNMEDKVHLASYGKEVTLYQLDLTKINEGILYFTTSVDPETTIVSFGGNAYIPVDIAIDGIEYSGKGALPQPTIRIANIHRQFTGLVANNDDLVGCQLVRIRTEATYLDNGATPNPHAHHPVDIFTIGQKTKQDKLSVEFMLQAAIDVEGQKIPNRQVLRNYCKRRYRRYDPQNGTFIYTNAQCPYTGSQSYDTNDNPTTPDKDHCSKLMTGCVARFGNDPLPSWAFPGAGRFGS